MKLCIPFLASDINQFNPKWVEDGFGIEASLFDRKHILDSEIWCEAKKNIQYIAESYSPSSFFFHFPVNQCNYLTDRKVRYALNEAFDILEKYKLNGMVLHTNQVLTVAEWKTKNVEDERKRYLDGLDEIREYLAGASFWVGIENMPIMGNEADELDPIFVLPKDGLGFAGGNIGLVWDFCHYSYTVYATELLEQRILTNRQDYPVIESCGYQDYLSIEKYIKHWHFSAFQGVALPGGTVCQEGQLPTRARISENIYAEAYRTMQQASAQTMTLEIAEVDYTKRKNIYEAIQWCGATGKIND